jgi:hypothetical protein
VVAHHVSVMTLQAGGLEQRLPADGADAEASGAAAAIRSTGKAALTELRRLLGVLRGDGVADDRQPQPDLDRIEEVPVDAAAVRPGGDALGLGAAGPPSAVVFPLCLAATLATAAVALGRRDATLS